MSQMSSDVLQTKVASGVMLLLGRTIVFRALSFGCQLVIYGLAKPEQMGIVGLIMAAVSLVSFLTDFEMVGALVRMPTYPSSQAIGAVAGWRVLMLCVLSLILLLFPPLMVVLSLPTYLSPLFALVMVASIPETLVLSARVHLQRTLNFKPSIAADFATLVITNIVLIIGLLVDKIEIAILSRFILVSFVNVVLFWRYQEKILINFRLAELKTIWKDSALFSLNALLLMLRDGATPAVVGQLTNLATVGYLGFATRLSFPLGMIQESLYRTTFPAASQMTNDREQLRKLVSRGLRYTAWTTYFLVALMIIILPVGTQFLFPRWQAAVPFVTIVLLRGAVNIPISCALAGVIIAVSGPRALVINTLAQMIAGWSAMALLAPTIGSLGIAVALVIQSVADVVSLLVVCPADLRPNILPVLLPPLLVTVSAMVITKLISSFTTPNLSNMAILLNMAVVVLCFAIGMSLFAKNETTAIRRILQRRSLAA